MLGGKDISSVKFFDVPETRDSAVFLNEYTFSDRTKAMALGMIGLLGFALHEIVAACAVGASAGADDGTELPVLYTLRNGAIDIFNLRRSTVLAPSLLARKARDRTATQVGRLTFSFSGQLGA